MDSGTKPNITSGAKLPLMVVDDEPDNLALLYRTFRREFEVFRADSAYMAMELLEASGEMAVIISDQRMPGMNGTEFLSRTVDRYPDTIRIVLTGYTDVEDLVEAINSGKVFKYITKPWDTNELKAMVHQAADTYRAIKQRTAELRRALRHESLLNAITSAIRESLNYQHMLQTIVNTIGQVFEVEAGYLWSVDHDRILPKPFIYQAPTTLVAASDDPEQLAITTTDQVTLKPLVEAAIAERKLQLAQNTATRSQLVIPLISQQACLAVLALCQPYTIAGWPDEDLQLIQGIAVQAALAISQAKLYQQTQEQAEQMRHELTVARQIQSNLLRQSWPEFEGLNLQACCHPAREVGGDFFEVFVHPQGDIWLAVGDVSGKGVPAALFMASAISVLRRELSQETSPDPAGVMQNLNSFLLDDLVSNNCFITMVVARYTPATRQLVYANAGHIYPMLWSNHQVLSYRNNGATQPAPEPEFLKERGVPLGILPIWRAAAGTRSLSAGDVFLLASDGITEAHIFPPGENPEATAGAMLQQSGLWELLLRQPVPLDLKRLLAQMRSYTVTQEDDQTLLALEVL
ncbi:SpoIIE family protein phosphatase [Trichothermofontia sp.]